MALLALALNAVSVGIRAEDDLRDADIREFIRTVAQRTGHNFILDPRVQGRVSIAGELPADPQALYRMFVSVMRVQGFALIDTNQITKIVPEAIARTLGRKEEGIPFTGEETTTEVFHLKHVTAAELTVALQPIVPPEAFIAASMGTNTITIADTRANIERVGFIIRALDRPVQSELDTVPLAHASAEEVAQQLNAVVQRDMAAQFKPATPAVADARSNSVVIQGDRDDILLMRGLIADLDTPLSRPAGAAVVYLKHGNAEDLVETLQGVADRIVANSAVAAVPATAVPAPAPAEAPDGLLPPPAPAATPSKPIPLIVSADKRTNAIILQGPAASIDAMRAVIDSLDIARAQVHVEAIIAEVSATRAAELGIQWRTNTPIDGALGGIILPGTTAGNIQGLTTDASTLGTGLSLGYLEAGTARVLLRALASDGSSNILSTPSLVTMDNEEAEIQIGQNVPIVTGQYTTTGADQGVTNPFQTVERKDVGVMLKVKPQITQGEVVRLAVEQELSAVSPSSAGADITLDKRALKTSVLVRDGEMIVIGGLLNNDVRQSTQKVPVVGDIPIIGDAARDRRSDVTNTNVLVFLRPRVIRAATVAAAITEDAVIDLRPDRNPPPQSVPLLPGERTPPLPSGLR